MAVNENLLGSYIAAINQDESLLRYFDDPPEASPVQYD